MALSPEKTEPRNRCDPQPARLAQIGVALMPQALGDAAMAASCDVSWPWVGARSSSSIAARVLLSAYRGGPKLKESFQMLEASIPRFCRP